MSGSGLHPRTLDPGLQHLPSISVKKTSGGVSWRWHGESYRKGKILAPFVLSHRFRTHFHAYLSLSAPASHLGSSSAASRFLRPAMAAHKPVEWVQAVITRFDEQVRWANMIQWMGVASFGRLEAPVVRLTLQLDRE